MLGDPENYGDATPQERRILEKVAADLRPAVLEKMRALKVAQGKPTTTESTPGAKLLAAYEERLSDKARARKTDLRIRRARMAKQAKALQRTKAQRKARKASK